MNVKHPKVVYTHSRTEKSSYVTGNPQTKGRRRKQREGNPKTTINVKVGCFSSGYLQFSGKSTDANRFCISFSKNLFLITLSSLNDHKTAKFLVALYIHLQSVALIAAVTVFS